MLHAEPSENFEFEELGNTTFSIGRDALKAVAEPLGPWNWAFFTGGTELTVVAGGIGSVEEMRTCYEEHPEDAWYQWSHGEMSQTLMR